MGFSGTCSRKVDGITPAIQEGLNVITHLPVVTANWYSVESRRDILPVLRKIMKLKAHKDLPQANATRYVSWISNSEQLMSPNRTLFQKNKTAQLTIPTNFGIRFIMIAPALFPVMITVSSTERTQEHPAGSFIFSRSQRLNRRQLIHDLSGLFLMPGRQP
ncbi:hypothetical protein OWV82_000489 [Melia azedarach]|uniref:Uncharacterized protein n=1 Tax=Melia azedarach TaxID=155640 RepID=A0ACC1YW10_MELAZ|nr:hypothetical protein OWV82_000489 [Melia azedarach]